MTIRGGVGYKALLDEANATVETISTHELETRLDDSDLVLVDIRDVRELEREGQIPGALHMPRGMLEFWIDPESPYSRPVFEEDKRFVFYCRTGWRSALATAVANRLGLQNASHLEGGFSAWKESDLEVADYTRKKSAASKD